MQIAIIENVELDPTLDTLILNRVGTAIRIVTALDQYDEQRFLCLIEKLISRTTLLATADAEGIGRLVLEHRWEDAAAILVARYGSGRFDVKPALRCCYDMLSFWERITLGLTPVSESEKWDGFQELATELYPGGPDDSGLWERAGGDNADLSTSGDGRTRWREVVRNIRNGRGPSPPALLAEMKKDFPNNERVLRLAGDRVFCGGVPDGGRGE